MMMTKIKVEKRILGNKKTNHGHQWKKMLFGHFDEFKELDHDDVSKCEKSLFVIRSSINQWQNAFLKSDDQKSMKEKKHSHTGMINQSMKKKAFWESDGQSIDEKRAFSASDDQSINKWGKSILRIWWSINQSMRRKRAFWESDDQSRSCSQVTAALRGTDIKPVIPSSNILDVRFPILSDFQIFQIVGPWLLS